jgi:O-succinylbenzoic acid--CoA ligase
MSWVHKDFQLNGRSFSDADELIQFAESISESLWTLCKDWFSTDDFILVRTSGSTGKPKSIQLKKEYMRNSALATGAYFNVHENTTALCCLPIEYIAGKMMLVRAMVLGWHLDVIEPRSNPLENIEKAYDFSAMVPLQLRNSKNKIHQIQQLIVGGGAVSVELHEMVQMLPTKIYATYGMTETITHIAVKPLNMASLGSRIERSHYETLSNISISTDERNCLVIQAPKVSDETIITNDVVDLISETEFNWKGRYDNVINSGGIKLHPEEIERKLSSHIKQRFFVAGIPDAELGERLVLVMEGAVDDAISNEVKNLKEMLSKYEIPKEIFFIDEFVETATQKIQRTKTLEKVLTK